MKLSSTFGRTLWLLGGITLPHGNDKRLGPPEAVSCAYILRLYREREGTDTRPPGA